MTTVQATLSKELERERASLLSGTRLHAFHWVILLFSVLLTLAAWYFAKTQSEKSAALQFDREASQVVELVSERMSKYEDALWAGVAALHSNGGQMNYDEWHSFAQSLHIDTKYPGINGIGIVLSVQDHEVPGHLASERRARAGYKLHPPVSTCPSFILSRRCPMQKPWAWTLLLRRTGVKPRCCRVIRAWHR